MICGRVSFCHRLVLVFLLAFCFTSFLFVNNTSAVSDITYSLDSSNASGFEFCNSSTPCSNYSYIIFESDSSVLNTASFNLASAKLPSGNFFNNFMLPLRSKYIILSLSNFNFSESNFSRFYINTISNFSSGTVTVTLTDKTPSFGSASGSIDITENGTYDVSNYLEAVVNVPPTVVPGDYHDDLVNIYHAIIICAGVCIVLYFFYCIYRMIIKSTGGH